ncbi:MAG: arginine--tRNA ligase [Bacteroidota bacterium]
MDFIIDATLKALKHLYQADLNPADISLQQTRKEFEGQVTIVTFPFTKVSRKSPEQTGTEIGQYLQNQLAEVSGFNVIKGFLNLSISDAYWLNQFYNHVLPADHTVAEPNGKKVMVEYSSPNTNKPLHLGHVRNNLLGYAVAQILAAAGYEVVKANLVNDRGIHICKSMLAWQLFGNGETPESAGLKGDHLVGKYYVIFDKEYKKQIEELKAAGQTEEEAKKTAPVIVQAQQMLQKWEAGDKEVINLWNTMNSWVYAGFDKTYKALGVNFDKFYYESNTYLLGKDIVEEGLEKGVFFKKPDGSVWIDLTPDGLDEKLVLRADGTSVYITQDLGTAQLKYNDFHMDQSLYVVGNEQDYHFKVLFLILDKLGKSWAKGLHHLSYGMVDLPSGKMKSREGTVVDADDLIREMEDTAKQHTEALGKVDSFDEAEKAELYHTIGMGALKYFLLKVEPKKRLLFDPNESIDFQGHTGPFIQYTHARIRSVISRAELQLEEIMPLTELSAVERDLIITLTQYPETVSIAAEGYNPAAIANYVYELAKAFNKFYHEKSILQAEDEQLKRFRLQLATASANIIKVGMGLMGIDVPERM